MGTQGKECFCAQVIELCLTTGSAHSICTHALSLKTLMYEYVAGAAAFIRPKVLCNLMKVNSLKITCLIWSCFLQVFVALFLQIGTQSFITNESNFILHRYGSRRSRSRSISGSPGSYRGHYRDCSRSQSPIRSPSPRDKRPPISEGLKSRLGPRIDDRRSPNKGRLNARSRSPGSSLSGSPDAVPPKRREAASRSRSSSASGHQGLVSYGDASPDTGAR